MKKVIYNFILKYLIRWKIEGDSFSSLNSLKKSVIITAPHTHWVDFYLGILIRGALDFKSSYLAKKELFIFPLSIFLKWTGGVPVNRSSNSNLVSQIASIYNKNKEFRLSLAPEGTRKRVEKWKSGFLRIAKKTDCKIVLVGIDFDKKICSFSGFFEPTGDNDQDIEFIKNFYKIFKPKIPSNF